MRTKDYYRYWIKLIEKWFEKNDSLTNEDFLKIQQFLEGCYKLDEKRMIEKWERFERKYGGKK